MSAGHVGNWLIVEKSGGPFTQAELNDMESQGYQIIAITAYDSNNNPSTHCAYGRYRGGIRGPASG